MDNEKILEIARRELPVICVHHIPEDIISFAQAIIKEERDAHGITTTIEVPTVVWDKLKDVNTVKDLIRALEAAEEE
jgi:hypothetical protein